MSPRTTLLPLATIACAWLGGCAAEGPAPREEMARAQALVGQADKSNAQRYAAADLQRAHDELATAQREYDARKFNEARAEAESAAVDADLASARAAAGQEQQAATQVTRSNSSLRSEAERAADASASAPPPPPSPPSPPPPAVPQ
jgi:hypothetical protein